MASATQTSFNTTEIENMAQQATKRKKADPNETKEQKLKRMVEVRVPRLLKSIDQLAGYAKFAPNKAQTEYVFGLVKKHVDAAMEKWTKKEAAEAGSFQFPT